MTSIDTLIERQLRRWEIEQRAAGEQHHKPRQQPPEIVTVSRQRGSRGSYFASRSGQAVKFHPIASGYNRCHLHQQRVPSTGG